MICFGAPVFAAGSGGRATAGVAIGILSGKNVDEVGSHFGPLVRHLADELSQRLGAARQNPPPAAGVAV